MIDPAFVIPFAGVVGVCASPVQRRRNVKTIEIRSFSHIHFCIQSCLCKRIDLIACKNMLKDSHLLRHSVVFHHQSDQAAV